MPAMVSSVIASKICSSLIEKTCPLPAVSDGYRPQLRQKARSSSRGHSRPASKSESRTRSNSTDITRAGSISSRRSSTPRLQILRGEVDRYGSYSKAMFNELFDAFDGMDLGDVSRVRRKDYFWALGSRALGGTLEFQKAVKRTRLSAHFYATAEDLTLEAYLQLAFPGASSREMKKFTVWASERKAFLLLTKNGFTSQPEDIRRLFDLLCADPSAICFDHLRLLNTEICTQEELDRILAPRKERRTHPLTFDEFQLLLTPFLTEKYGVKTKGESPDWRQMARKKLAAVQAFSESAHHRNHGHPSYLPPLPSSSFRGKSAQVPQVSPLGSPTNVSRAVIDQVSISETPRSTYTFHLD